MACVAKPSQEHLWYGELTEWEGEKCLLTNEGRLVIGRFGPAAVGSWDPTSTRPEQLVIVGFGGTPPGCVSLEDLVKESECDDANRS